MKDEMKKPKIIIMGAWNTDGGVSRHTMPLVEWMIAHDYNIKVFTHYNECAHGYPLDVEDEDFVYRCFTLSGKKIPAKVSFGTELLLNTVEQEGYNIFLAEDLGMLPMEKLLEVFPRIKAKTKTILLNHDNIAKPDDSPFWKFDWDAIANFLPQQNRFMTEHYPLEKIHCIDFPTHEQSRANTKKSCEKMGLPTDRNIILTFGEYNMVDFLPAICKMKIDDPSIFLLALVYDEEYKIKLKKQIAEKKEIYSNIGYDEIRIEHSSWQRRRDYVHASKIVIFDKGKGGMGSGALLSSSAYQIIGWGTPILARDNLFFSPFRKGELLKYKNDSELTECVRILIHDKNKREEIIASADEFAVNHSPEKISSLLLGLFNGLMDKGELKR